MGKPSLYRAYNPKTKQAEWRGKRLSGENIVRAEDGKGIRAANWEKETSAKKRTLWDEPQVDKPRVLINSTQVIGADKLTAHDIALHEYLLASARRQGIGKGVHEVSLAQLGEYLDVPSKERLWKSLERLMATTIRYSVIDQIKRCRVQEPMISRVAISTNRLTGKTTFEYIIPSFVRYAMLKSRSQAWLDINAFARFSSKYASRLYPKLALMAGYNEELRKPWCPSVEKLAVFLGYAARGEEFHVGSFMRVVDKAVEEIAQHVSRFEVTYVRPKRGKGRGRPVEGVFYFQTSSAILDLSAYPEQPLPPTTVNRIEDRRHTLLAEREHPSVRMFSQAAQMTGRDADELLDKWKHDVVTARHQPKMRFGAMTGAMLVEALDTAGLLPAFKMWAKMAVMLEHLTDFGPHVDVPDFTIREQEPSAALSGGQSGSKSADVELGSADELPDDYEDLSMADDYGRYVYDFEDGDLGDTGGENEDADIPW